MSQRKADIDVTRGIGILLVVYAHVLELFFQYNSFHANAFEQWRYIYAFHMPLFYFVSGSVAKLREPLSRVLARVTFLYLITALTHLVGVMLPWVYAVIRGAPYPLSASTFLSPLLYGSGFSLVVTWFLISLGIVQLSFWLFTRSGLTVRVLIVAGLALLHFLAHRYGWGAYSIHTVPVGFLFFSLGHWVLNRPSRDIPPPLLMASLLLSGVLFLASVPLNGGCTFWFGSCNPTRHPAFAVHMLSGYFGFLPAFVLTALLGIVGTLAISRVIARTPFSAVFEWLGKNSLLVLLVNGLFLSLIGPRIAPGLNAVFHSSLGIMLAALGVTFVQAAAGFAMVVPYRRIELLLRQLSAAMVQKVAVVVSKLPFARQAQD
jgi:acyltransferase